MSDMDMEEVEITPEEMRDKYRKHALVCATHWLNCHGFRVTVEDVDEQIRWGGDSFRLDLDIAYGGHLQLAIGMNLLQCAGRSCHCGNVVIGSEIEYFYTYPEELEPEVQLGCQPKPDGWVPQWLKEGFANE